MNTKTHNKSPLPFQGQKRNFIKEYKKALNNFPEDSIYVDLFGGSGLLSHVTKREKPNAKVIYNDYDNFNKRLDTISITNLIIKELRDIVKDIPIKNKIVGEDKSKILKVIEKYDKEYNVDYITLSTNLLFSMNYVSSLEELRKETFYNRVRKSDYNAKGYLDGVKIISEDYKKVFKTYKDCKNVVFLVDPPYLSTDCSTYKNYWKLSDYLDVLKVLINTKYFYFTSNKSSVLELCQWIENNTGGTNPFNEAKVKYQYNTVGRNSAYTDIMIYKNWNTNTTL